MFALKSALASALVASGVLASSLAPARAGDASFGIHFDSHGNVGIHIGIGHGGHGHGGFGGKCTKSEALGKAASLGLYNRSIKSVTASHITVGGKLAGDKVRLVLKRKTPNCAVKNLYYV